jgi:hypothetical protein
MNRATQYEQFQRDITAHEMRVFVDDGVRRHLRFAKPGTYCLSFDLVTWPGYLCYTGDMGAFVFTRLPDMFEFFRGREDGQIDMNYWAEKCVASDKSDGLREYSEQRFRSAVKDDYDAFVEAESLQDSTAQELWAGITDDVLSCAENHHEAVQAAMNFQWQDPGSRRNRSVFPNFWEHRLEDFTPRFVWCCYALRWAIARYDTAKETEPQTTQESA